MRISASLRQRQGQQVRTAVLEAAIGALETRDVDDLSMADIAEASGVSLRTLYRYFPDRASLLEEAGERLYAQLGVRFDIVAPEEIAASFRDAARRLSARPKLTRALVQSRAGRVTRSGVRGQRVQAIGAALESISTAVDPGLARRARAVITHLCSAAAWVGVAEESGLPDPEAQEGVAWAIDALVRTLRQSAGQGAAPRGRAPSIRTGGAVMNAITGPSPSAALEPRALSTEAGHGRAWWFLGTLAVLRNPDGAPATPTVIELTIPPGGSPPLHVHDTLDDSFLLLEGEVFVRCGERTLVARPGTYVVLPAGVEHTFRVTSTVAAKMLLVHARDDFLAFIEAVGTPTGDLRVPPPDTDDFDREALIRAGAAHDVRIVGPTLNEGH